MGVEVVQVMKGVVVNPVNRMGIDHNKNVDSPLHAYMYTPPALVLLMGLYRNSLVPGW